MEGSLKEKLPPRGEVALYRKNTKSADFFDEGRAIHVSHKEHFRSLDERYAAGQGIEKGIITHASGPQGKLPFTREMLLDAPSGELFRLSQNVGMGWDPTKLTGKEFLILSTLGGMRDPDGEPVALGYHTGHWEVGLLVEACARTLKEAGHIPYAAYCSDPCDGRSQGTTGMFDSLAYRNDASVVLRRLIRSLPTRKGLIGVATCDKGLPAMMIALAGMKSLPSVIVPGGVTLPPSVGEDAGTIQSVGARYAHGEISLEEAAEMGCRTCASPGGGCQFLGTAATSQVVAEALGMALPHSALAPSGQEIWLQNARHAGQVVAELYDRGITLGDILTDEAIHNAMVVHAAFGGSTNLLLHIPAIAHAAGLRRPTVEDWQRVNHQVPRLVDALPNGPMFHPTVRVFLAGGVPEVMLHLRRLGLIEDGCLTSSGYTWDEVLDWWEQSERRQAVRARLLEADGIDPDDVIMGPDRARQKGLTSTVTFPTGNIAPEGSVVKSTAIDPTVLDADGVYRKVGRARVFTTEPAAMAAIKATDESRIQAGDVLILMGRGPMGSGMEEIAQITIALRYLPFGKHVTVLTDARFSGTSAGACIGHIGPEALAGGPLGKVRDGDQIEVIIDCKRLVGSINLVGTAEGPLTPEEADRLLAERPPHPDLRPDSSLPPETRLWAAMQAISGGTWGGCVYEVDQIVAALEEARQRQLESAQLPPESKAQ